MTHNIEEAVMLADRVMVAGKKPIARIRSDFNIRLKHPRDRKSARFVELVDYIYKVMTEPELEHDLPDAETTAEIILPTGGFTKDVLEEAGINRSYGAIPIAAPRARGRDRGPDRIAP